MKKFILITFFSLFAMTTLKADFDSTMGLYLQGDYENAHREFTLLANEGNADAQLMLGDMYSNGQGVDKNLVQAYKWYELSSKNGSRAASLSKIKISQQMDENQISEGNRLAAEWQPGTTDFEESPDPSPFPASNGETPDAIAGENDTNKSENGYFSNLARSVTGLLGGPGRSSSTSSNDGTVGIRGLEAEKLREARSDINELKEMESYKVDARDANMFANEVNLVARNIDYLNPDITIIPEQTPAVNTLQSK